MAAGQVRLVMIKSLVRQSNGNVQTIGSRHTQESVVKKWIGSLCLPEKIKRADDELTTGTYDYTSLVDYLFTAQVITGLGSTEISPRSEITSLGPHPPPPHTSYHDSSPREQLVHLFYCPNLKQTTDPLPYLLGDIIFY